MRAFPLFLLAGLAAITIAGCSSFNVKPIPPVAQLDLQRFMGD